VTEEEREGQDNVIALPTLAAASDPAGAAAMALRIRSSLSTLQGYADFLQGASPAVQSEAPRIASSTAAEKGRPKSSGR